MKSYVNFNRVIEDLFEFGDQAVMIGEIAMQPEVERATRALNIIAEAYGMFPKLPQVLFEPFRHFDIRDCKGIIVGGMPVPMFYSQWTGAGYSYLNGTRMVSELHRAISAQSNQAWRLNNASQDSRKLMKSKILLLHDVMSIANTTNKEILEICRNSWELIIWMILNYMSYLDREVPIMFTTSVSQSKFNSAVRMSKNVVNPVMESSPLATDGARISGAGIAHFESLMNKGLSYEDKINLASLL